MGNSKDNLIILCENAFICFGKNNLPVKHFLNSCSKEICNGADWFVPNFDNLVDRSEMCLKCYLNSSQFFIDSIICVLNMKSVKVVILLHTYRKRNNLQ